MAVPFASSALVGSVASANKSIETKGTAMETVMQEQDSRVEGLPARVQEALGELVGAAKEGLLAL